ncbi:gamma-interferon-inducible lysosomal thiol reductase isoform X3 [Drosophila gunungcola]|uniref:gamma-interferon-inducible lysosomal thiol reductase isoform X3 n=1 Tax=Drosophila gunungcola TaxID=103775 RepID=UPI0022E1504A|nr:gamma-interferon-inducible lysosomal thiol reductase isoform X3 [Drosophila gunungcola]
MVSTRKRIAVIICVIVLLVCLLRIFFWNSPIPILTNQRYNESNGRPPVPVVVMVFYEALCPDSKYFLTKQLLPTFKVAASIMEHGPAECQANIYHACTAKIIEDPLLRLQVATCMIRDNRLPQDAMHKCSKQHNFENVDLIQNCFDSDHGVELLKRNGEATHALRPSVTFIPTITIDGSQGRQASILKDLFSEVCKAAGESEEAKNVCRNHKSN